MAVRWAVVCSGQGEQSLAMASLLASDEAAWHCWQTWRAGHPALQGVDFDADSSSLFANRVAQAVIVGFGLAAWRALDSQLPPPSIVAGYSIGEMTAYGVAGVWSTTELLRLTDRRAQAMDEAACAQQSQAQAMMAVTGLPFEQVQALLIQDGVYLAIDNGNHSVVLGGLRVQLELLEPVLVEQGGRVQVLPLKVASHTPLMQYGLDGWQAALRGASWQPPQYPLLAGINGERIRHREAALHALTQQLVQPVRWADCMTSLAEAGIELVLELGPGTALTRMIRMYQPHWVCRSLADFRTLHAAKSWLNNQLG